MVDIIFLKLEWLIGYKNIIVFLIFLMLLSIILVINVSVWTKKLKKLTWYIPDNPEAINSKYNRNDIITFGCKNKKTILSINTALNANGYNKLSFNECFDICKNSEYNKDNLYKCFFDNYEICEQAYKEYNYIENLTKLKITDYIKERCSLLVFLLFTTWLEPKYLFYLLFIFTIIILFADIINYHKLKKSIKKWIKNHETELYYTRYYILKNKIQKELDNYYRKEEDRKRLEEEKKLKQQRSYWQKYWSDKQQDGFDFENAVGELYRKLGYKVKVTQGTGDGGVDLILQKDGQTIIVQCKAHTHQVGPEPVRALWGVKEDFDADSAIFVAYSGVTQGAKNFAKGKKLSIVDVDELIQLSIQVFLEK